MSTLNPITYISSYNHWLRNHIKEKTDLNVNINCEISEDNVDDFDPEDHKTVVIGFWSGDIEEYEIWSRSIDSAKKTLEAALDGFWPEREIVIQTIMEDVEQEEVDVDEDGFSIHLNLKHFLKH